MSHASSWILKAGTLAMVALVGAALVTSVDVAVEAPETALGGSRVAESSESRAIETASAEVVHAVELGDSDDILEPAAICRLIPECWKNSDCDARCGVGLGNRDHSNCPPRICRCR